MTTKMKGLLKGLRYISQIFDNEKEQEMQIGYPTDVKHVAHIGWDGPSVNSPSWMNEFRSKPEYSSAPLSITGDANEDPSVKSVPEDSSHRGARTHDSLSIHDSPARDLPELPKSSRRGSTRGSSLSNNESPSREKSDKPRHSRRHQSKDSQGDSTKSIRQLQDPSLGNESPSHSLPDIPKKSRRKKSKDSSGGGSTRSKDSSGGGSTRSSRSKAKDASTYQSPFSDPGSGSVSNYKNDDQLYPTSPLQRFEDGKEKECSAIS